MSNTGWTDDRLMQAYDLIEAVYLDGLRVNRSDTAQRALLHVRSQIVIADEVMKAVQS